MTTPYFEIDESLLQLARQAETQCGPVFARIDEVSHHNSQKVLRAFSDQRISESHLSGTTGYGYGDRGREALEAVYAQVFGCEDALVRHHFASGTHAIAVALFGLLRPGDHMLSVTGLPYDTLLPVIGLDKGDKGSLRDFGIRYSQVDLTSEGSIDMEKVLCSLEGVQMVYLQRSRGYSLRESISISQMEILFAQIREVRKDILIVVDNCYGEFVEEQEPTQVGADLIIGSLIKNPGGGLAETGAYIAGRADLVELCACRLTSPATGKEIGATLGQNKSMIQGFFMAPHTVAQALKTAVFAACLLDKLGYAVDPAWDAHRTDIIQAVGLYTPEKLVAFCKGIQQGAPIDSFVSPEPWDMPGYHDQVIMAAGAFNMGASIELSADAPLRPPYAVWLQGGLTYESGRIGILLAVQNLLREK